MKDIQGQPDYRRINIKKVGVKNISYPITVLDKSQTTQKTVATVNMYVNLPHHFKGTHMSRFIEILNRYHGEITIRKFHLILEEMKLKLQAEAAHMELEFPYFLHKSDRPRPVDLGRYQCRMHGSLQDKYELTLEVRVPISSPAPSQEGSTLPRSLGHWGVADISLRFRQFIWLEDIIHAVEQVTSHSHVWEGQGFAPKDSLSVEKIAEDLADKLAETGGIRWFSVRVSNFAEGFTTFSHIEWPEKTNEQPVRNDS